jgi:translation initiation factor 3 subunit L
MANIELNQQGLSSRVPQCQITIYHYVGFCYLMMRRYKDAMRSFESILLYIQRVQSFYSGTSTYDDMVRKREHIFALLALTYTLSPARMEESVTKEMMISNRERIERIQSG